MDGVLYDRSNRLIAYPNSKEQEELKPEDFDKKTSQIEPWAFMNNKYLKRIELPRGISRVRRASFSGADALEEVILPVSVSYVENYAFDNCKNLKKVTVLNRNAKFEADRRGDDPLEENIFRDSSKDAVLCGYAGSTAEKYAETHGLKFEVLEEEKK